jgi:hypothetical protein
MLNLSVKVIIYNNNIIINDDNNDIDNNLIELDSIISYLCAESTATKPITDTARQL